MSGPLLFLLAAMGLAAAMSGAWATQRALGNAGWVDVVWTLATGAGGVICALVPTPGAAGHTPRQLVVAALAAAWSLRLAWHIAARTAGKPEDVRYAGFRRDWGADYQRRMFIFLMIQAAAAAVLVLAMLVAARNPAPGIGPLDIAAILVLAGSVLGEGIADAQLAAFRGEGGHGRICDRGLWGWSRHPNYFFETLGWCAYPLLALSDPAHWPAGLLALAAPAFMYWLLRYVSGVPPLEQAMLASRGDAFVAYQQRVSVFFLRPPRTI